ncbi:hypothetical protein F4678DRAFT_426447 [Xylaria arbuscula]|nr:hypothetical protein F4678DRAFT_426447 [Xylaria arbuscula]
MLILPLAGSWPLVSGRPFSRPFAWAKSRTPQARAQDPWLPHFSDPSRVINNNISSCSISRTPRDAYDKSWSNQ